MKGLKINIALALIILCLQLHAAAADRKAPEKPDVKKARVKFNKDSIKASYVLLDVRTKEEKKANRNNRKLSGPVLVLFHGHNQRADDGYVFTSKIALKSKSGILIIPICDTPYGKNPKWRGDRGKDLILMEVVRYILNQKGIGLDGYTPINNEFVSISPFVAKKTNDELILTKIAALGWSHGGILARRSVSSHPALYTAMAQTNPAGYVHWGKKKFIAPFHLLAHFNYETMRIGTGVFRKEGKHVMDAATGVIKGVTEDTTRSFSSCILGNFHMGKPFRAYRDLKECTTYTDDSNFPVGSLDRLIVVFGDNDSLFRYNRHAGIKNPKIIQRNERDKFFSKFYPKAVMNNTKLELKVLPGNHIGPMVYSDQYAETLLKGINQFRN